MNDYNNAMSQAGHRLELIGRERLTVSGVEDVERVYRHLLRMAESGQAGPRYLHMGQRSSEQEVL